MKCVFDQDTGRLRFDDAGFDALYALASGDELSHEDASALRDVGVLETGGVHQRLEPGMHAIGNAMVHARLSMADEADRNWHARIWISGHAAAYLLSADDLLDELIISGPRFFAASIARIVGLGPRIHRAFAGWSMPADHCAQLISARQSDRQRIADTLEPSDEAGTEFVNAVVEGPWHYWTLEVQWDLAAGSEPRPPLHILDTTHGIAVLSPDGEDITVDALSPTETWLALSMLLPEDDELAQSK